MKTNNNNVSQIENITYRLKKNNNNNLEKIEVVHVRLSIRRCTEQAYSIVSPFLGEWEHSQSFRDHQLVVAVFNAEIFESRHSS